MALVARARKDAKKKPLSEDRDLELCVCRPVVTHYGHRSEELTHTTSQQLPLHSAAAQGDLQAVSYFIQTCGMLVDTTATRLHMTPLHSACLSALDEVLSVVLSGGGKGRRRDDAN